MLVKTDHNKILFHLGTTKTDIEISGCRFIGSNLIRTEIIRKLSVFR